MQFKPWKFLIKEFLSNIKKPGTNYSYFLPLWNHYNHCGTPLIANLQSQVFYPFSIIFYLIRDFSVAFKIFIILHFFISMISMFLFLWSKKLKFFSCLVGSLLWTFNGYMVSRIEFLSVFPTISWFPLIILLFSTIKDKIEFKKIIYISLAIAVQFLAGHAQMWVYSVMFLMFYSIYQSYRNKTTAALLSFVYSIIISLFISAIQFLPTAEFFFYTTRAGEGIKNLSKFGMLYEEAKLGSLHIVDLLNLLYPFNWQINIEKLSLPTGNINLTNYWLYTFYIGIVGLILAVIGFFYLKDIKDKIFYFLVTIITIFYSLGENFIFFKILYKILPFIRIFRHPSTIIYISLFILSLFSSYGTHYISNIFKKYQYKKLTLLLPTICFFELYFYSIKISMLLPKSILDEKKEIINFLIRQNEKDNYEYRFAHTPLTLKIGPSTKGDTLYSAIAKYRDKLFSNINLEYYLYNFRGQDIELKNYFKFLDFVYMRKSLNEALPFFSIANVKYIFSIVKYKNNNLNILKDNKEIVIYENPFVLKRVYTIKKIIVEPDIDKSLTIMEKLKYNILDTAIVHSEEIKSYLKENTYKQANVIINYIDYYYNKIFIDVFTDQPTFLVLSQNHYPGWKCSVNNSLTKIFHCNIFMSCIYIPTGKNKIYLYYDPMSFKIGCLITLVCILSILIYFFETNTKFKNF